jgi:hypothetical protein
MCCFDSNWYFIKAEIDHNIVFKRSANIFAIFVVEYVY